MEILEGKGRRVDGEIVHEIGSSMDEESMVTEVRILSLGVEAMVAKVAKAKVLSLGIELRDWLILVEGLLHGCGGVLSRMNSSF